MRVSKNGPDKTAAFTALSCFLRVLAGHVYEAYKFFRKEVRVDKLRKSKSIRLDADFDADIKRLKTYFGRTNVISKMRNQFSFHTDPDLLRKSFEGVPADFTYEAILGQEYRGHNIFYGSEIVILGGFQRLRPDPKWKDAINSCFIETIEIADLVTKVFERLVVSIMEEHLKITMDDAEELTATDGPPFDAVVVPFFCQPPAGHSAK